MPLEEVGASIAGKPDRVTPERQLGESRHIFFESLHYDNHPALVARLDGTSEQKSRARLWGIMAERAPEAHQAIDLEAA